MCYAETSNNLIFYMKSCLFTHRTFPARHTFAFLYIPHFRCSVHMYMIRACREFVTINICILKMLFFVVWECSICILHSCSVFTTQSGIVLQHRPLVYYKRKHRLSSIYFVVVWHSVYDLSTVLSEKQQT